MEIELKLVRTLLLFQNKGTRTTLSNLNYYKFRFLTNFYIICFAMWTVDAVRDHIGCHHYTSDDSSSVSVVQNYYK